MAGSVDPRFRPAPARAAWLAGTLHLARVDMRERRSPGRHRREPAARCPKGRSCAARGRAVAWPSSSPGHEFAEGGETILDELAKHRARASFFLTGDFLANPRFEPLVRRIVKEGHYLGPHSDKHLLYCTWDQGRKTLVAKEAFAADLRANLEKIARFGVDRPRYFLPPYEHWNRDIAAWTAELGLQLVNFTPGTRSNADYTEDAAPNFVSSRTIFESIIRRERQDPDGLSGFLLLLHIGAGPRRTDPFHTRFGELLDDLAGKGYRIVRVDELLGPEEEPR